MTVESEPVHSGERRRQAINAIMEFVNQHRESYASLAVCRRAVYGGLDAITGSVINQLGEHLEQAPNDEIEAYYYIVQ